MIIYVIENIKNNKKYIGGTKRSLKIRKTEHLVKLRANKHKNKLLQDDFNKYGENSFIFEIVEELEKEDYSREEYWITKMDSFNNGYNMNKNGSNFYGMKFSKETRLKMSKNNYAKINGLKDETKNKISKKIKEISNKYSGENNYNVNLCKDDYLKIKSLLLKDNLSFSEKYKLISKEIKVSDSTVKRIKNGSHWSCKKYLNGGYKDWIKEVK